MYTHQEDSYDKRILAAFDDDAAFSPPESDKTSPEVTITIALDLVESRAFPKGITIQVYRPGARSMQPTKARDIGDARDDRPDPAVWPRPTHVGNEKYLADFWIIEAADLDVALKPATEGVEGLQVEGLQSEGRGAAQRYESRRSRLRPAQVSSDGFERVGSFTIGVPESLERNPGGGVGSGQRCS